jgi:hypothetical protein
MEVLIMTVSLRGRSHRRQSPMAQIEALRLNRRSNLIILLFIVLLRLALGHGINVSAAHTM